MSEIKAYVYREYIQAWMTRKGNSRYRIMRKQLDKLIMKKLLRNMNTFYIAPCGPF